MAEVIRWLSLQEALALVVDIGVGMSDVAPGYDSPLQTACDILQMIVQRKVCSAH